ncbi:MAG TPA: pseudouridine synthase [Nitrospiria bacterium]
MKGSGKPHRNVSLARALSKMGFTSRKLARELIESGRVTVNGRPLKNPEVRVDPDREAIRVDGQIVRPAGRVYLMMHKPKGVVTTRSDERGRMTVYALLSMTEWVFPVGRLDRDSSGLLLLTNDTQWGNSIAAPDSKISKVYQVRLDRAISPEDLSRLASGVTLEDGVKTLPARARQLPTKETEYRIELTLTEGMNRQVRRMCKALEYRVLELIRVRIGGLELGSLPPGGVRPLTPDEVRRLGPEESRRRH